MSAYDKARDYRGYKKEYSFLVQKRGQLMGMVGYIDDRLDHIFPKLAERKPIRKKEKENDL